MMNKAPKNFRGKAKCIPDNPKAFLLPYQSKWVKDSHFLKLMEKSRRIGISYATSYRTVRKHANRDYTNDTWYSSRDDITARLSIQDCKSFLQMLKTAAEDLGTSIVAKEKVYSIKFTNNTELNSVASNPDVFAGKGGDVILDEFALRKDPAAVYGIAAPSIDWGGGMEIISTHRGSQNFFNQLVKEIREKGNPKNFSHHKVTLQDALDQGFLFKTQQKYRDGDPRLEMTEADYFTYIKNRCPNIENFNQEYCCIPEDDNIAFLSYDTIHSCHLDSSMTPLIEKEETISFAGKRGEIRKISIYKFDTIANMGIPLYIGVDIGRDHDLTVIFVMASLLGIMIPLTIIEMYNVEFSRQELELYPYIGLHYTMRACIDNTGIGKQFAERAQQKFGMYRVEACTFTQQFKEQIAYPVRTAFEDRTIRIPDDELITADLRAIKKETTASGNIRFYADRGKNGHADRFWGLALAKHAQSSGPTGPTWAVSPSAIAQAEAAGIIIPSQKEIDIFSGKIDYDQM